MEKAWPVVEATAAGISSVASQTWPELSGVVADEARHWSQEWLDAVQEEPHEVVKELAWDRVVNARAWGNSWQIEVNRGREGAQVRRVDTSKPTNPPTYRTETEYDTLHFNTAKLLQEVELDIAQGVAGDQLEVVLDEQEKRLWKQAILGAIPVVNQIVALYDSFQNIYESLEAQLFRTLSEQLQKYPPFGQLQRDLQAAALGVSLRQQELIERLGIHAGSLQ